MKTKLTETKFESAIGQNRTVIQQDSMLGSSYFNLLQCIRTEPVRIGKRYCPGGCEHHLKFTWDGGQSIFASGLTKPGDLAFDRAGNLLVVDYGSGGTPCTTRQRGRL